MPAPAANRRSADCSSVITLKQTMDKVVQSFRRVDKLVLRELRDKFGLRYQVVMGARALGGILLLFGDPVAWNLGECLVSITTRGNNGIRLALELSLTR